MFFPDPFCLGADNMNPPDRHLKVDIHLVCPSVLDRIVKKDYGAMCIVLLRSNCTCPYYDGFLSTLLQLGMPTCKQKIDPGKCKAAITTYGYNSETHRCEKFIYGGCGGNINRFDTLEKCQKKCEKKRHGRHH
ncbi:unnamed protein product [Dibothriocephalus latus]|uniref:BPTI/Kunitz inhibitor domain-containing protein n=1 Tax=Dibothriocephalus latus TaxID=60516 RepID=A0A3P7NAY1_DIBLA|nr:unnamed protein product [Dibothriocephalus latus]